MSLFKNSIDLTGNTPLLELESLKKELNLKANIYAKLEYFNPAGSVKDRVAKQMILDAIEKGLINKDTVIIEPTSGNTGIGLAFIGKAFGLKVIIVMPDTMSVERRQLITAYGAELVLTEGAKGMKGAIEKANELAKVYPNSFIPSQFDNPSNTKAHYLTTGKEIYNDLGGKVDCLVSGVGTGGTISGTGKYLKEKNKDIYIVAVEPSGSPILSQGYSGPHKIQGIGAGFVPKVLDTSIYDEVFPVSNEDAFATAKLLRDYTGILVGISSGAALFASIKLAKQDKFKGKNIVVILPDGGNKYLSTPLFQ